MRHADFAGTWYPGTRSECLRMIAEFERELGGPAAAESGAVGVIAPHAGWVYSGVTAWSALCRAASPDVSTMVIFGTHLAPDDAPSVLVTDAWKLPARMVEIDEMLARAVAGLDGFLVETDTRHRRDNSIELLVALAAFAWPNARLVAVSLPPRPQAVAWAREIADLARAGCRDRTLFAGSTDLTHYGPSYGFAPAGSGRKALAWVEEENDAAAIERMLAADAAGVIACAAERQNACCAGAAAGAIAASGAKRGVLTDRRTSAARAGGVPEDFVGYAGVLLVDR